MVLFEGRVLKVNESEEEFMLHLLRLYQAANPDHAAAVTLLAIKRKFMAGISPLLRNKVFIFCADPYDAGVTREALLGHCRRARNLLQPSSSGTESTHDRSTDRVLVANHDVDLFSGGGETGMIAAINNLAIQMSEHRRSTDMRLEEFGGAIAAVTSQQNNFRGRGRGGRGSRGNYYNNNNRSYNNRGGGYSSNYNNFSSGGNNNAASTRGSRSRGSYRGGFRGGYNNGGVVRCFNCNGSNHRSAHCTANSEN